MTKTNRILSVFLGLAVLSLTTSSCKKYFEDYVATPNNPTEVTPALLLASVEVSTFATFGGQLARQGGVMIQHVAGTSAGSQTVEIANYNITELTNVNEWSGIYEGAIMDANIIIRDFGGDNPYYAGIARILIAANVGLASDLWGDVPLSAASGGQTGNLNPTYDSQESVFQQIQQLCDQAIIDLSLPASANSTVPSSDDFIYGGDAASWIKAARVLKARYFNRLSKRDGAGSANAALAALNAGVFGSSAEDANLVYGEGNALNQWYAFEQSRGGYIKVSSTFVDNLASTSDPRLPVFVGLDAQGGYSGTPPDDVDMDTWRGQGICRTNFSLMTDRVNRGELIRHYNTSIHTANLKKTHNTEANIQRWKVRHLNQPQPTSFQYPHTHKLWGFTLFNMYHNFYKMLGHQE